MSVFENHRVLSGCGDLGIVVKLKITLPSYFDISKSKKNKQLIEFCANA